MDIVKAESEDLEECTNIIFASELGKIYYPNRNAIYEQIREGICTGDKVYVAKNSGGDTEGCVWYQQKGMFRVFPYLHIIAVKNECQCHGIGKILLDFFEYDALCSGYNRLRTKVFLTVGDFNVGAERFYLKSGYRKIGEIENLYRKKITEKIYMKVVRASDFRQSELKDTI